MSTRELNFHGRFFYFFDLKYMEYTKPAEHILHYFGSKHLFATRYWLFCGVYTLVVARGKENGANGRIGRENELISKRKWVLNHRNLAILLGDNDWILISDCSWSRATDPKCSSIFWCDRHEMANYKQFQIKLDWI